MRRSWPALLVTSLTLAIVAVCVWRPSRAADESAPADAAHVELQFALQSADGAIHSLQASSPEHVRVFVFLTGECPISRSYLPALNRLQQAWSEAGAPVALFGVGADNTQPPAAVAQFATEFAVAFPVLLDPQGELARRLQPTHVPEVFVLAADGRLAYRGRIDDVYLEIGRRRPAATEHNLHDAVAAVLRGEAVAVPRTEAVGCLYETFEPVTDGAVTYSRDIAPLLAANCVVCHRTGEVGPFSLASYVDAAKRADQLALVVERKLMPPWMPAETHGEFLGQRTLTDEQVALFRAWAAGGAPEGDPALAPPAAQFASGWRLGEPDLILEMPAEFDVPADGPDIFQNFVIPIDLPEDKLVAAVDFQPGDKSVVHHTLFFLDNRGQARELDAATPELGYSSFGGPGFLPTGAIGGWSPGNTPRRLPEGLGRYLKQGSDLVMQIHYHPSGKAARDCSRVGVYFVEQPKNVVAGIWAASYTIDIPAGESRYQTLADYTLPQDVTLVGIVPHMHLLGRSVRAVATLPDGTKRQLIDVPQWNYAWQDEYYYAQPIHLPQGTRLDVTAIYDNSADNPSNPHLPPRRVTWGEETTDEMLYCFFLVMADQPRNLVPLIFNNLAHDLASRKAGGQSGGYEP